MAITSVHEMTPDDEYWEDITIAKQMQIVRWFELTEDETDFILSGQTRTGVVLAAVIRTVARMEELRACEFETLAELIRRVRAQSQDPLLAQKDALGLVPCERHGKPLTRRVLGCVIDMRLIHDIEALVGRALPIPGLMEGEHICGFKDGLVVIGTEEDGHAVHAMPSEDMEVLEELEEHSTPHLGREIPTTSRLH